jgi:hypothetical protein
MALFLLLCTAISDYTLGVTNSYNWFIFSGDSLGLLPGTVVLPVVYSDVPGTLQIAAAPFTVHTQLSVRT